MFESEQRKGAFPREKFLKSLFYEIIITHYYVIIATLLRIVFLLLHYYYAIITYYYILLFYYYCIITSLLRNITWILPGITEFLNFHDLSYNRGSMQDIMPFMLHLYTLDLSTTVFFLIQE